MPLIVHECFKRFIVNMVQFFRGGICFYFISNTFPNTKLNCLNVFIGKEFQFTSTSIENFTERASNKESNSRMCHFQGKRGISMPGFCGFSE